ncbi:MAG: integrase [Rhodospirillales bacterium]|nr:integrase [Rhodospirillales bacterium]
MSTLQQEVYEAFRSINVPEEQALKAAASLAKRDVDVVELKRDVALLKWGQGVTIALLVAAVVKLFFP